MSRNSQKNYLAGLLTEDEDLPPVETKQAPPSPLLTRATSLGRLASGEIKQVTHLRLDPGKCRIWPGNGRDYAALSVETCQDLIDAFKAEGGQKIPALVRRVKDDPNYEYEVIYGTRRHWTATYLRANNYPETAFLAEVRDIDDEAAFRLADIENRARKDITELERARNYAMALPLHYAGKQARMAERLNLSPGWLSKMLSFASVPQEILDAFGNTAALSLKQGYRLYQGISAPEHEKRALEEARGLIAEQCALADAGKAGIPSEQVLARLLQAASGEQKTGFAPQNFMHQGRAVVTLLDDNRNGIRLQIHQGTGAGVEAILVAVKAALLTSSLGAGESPAPSKNFPAGNFTGR